jgi:MFS family permease
MMARTPVFDLPQSWQTWRRRVERWYLAYALLGITATGAVPILLPLALSRLGNAMDIGLVMAAISLGGLLAPWWGTLADRYRLHRCLLAGGLVVAAVGLAVLPFVTMRVVWLGLALLYGCGVSGASTVATLLIVEVHPETEWDERIAWLQTCHDAGHVGGLLLAAGLYHLDVRLSLLILASIAVLAAMLGWVTTRTPLSRLTPKPVLFYPARNGEWARHAPQHLYHHAYFQALRQLAPALRSPFGLFLGTWLLSLLGSSAFFALYPVLAREVFGIAPLLSSSALALAVSLRLVLYVPVGHWSCRLGPACVLRWALGLRLLTFVGLFGLGLLPTNSHGRLALLGFILIMLCWALLSVSSTALTAHLAPGNQGESMGLFNAVSALAGVLGATLGGWLAAQWGYNAASGLAVVGLTLGLCLSLTLPKHLHAHAQPEPHERT